MRFNNFSDNELDMMEEAFCEAGLKSFVFEIRREREQRRETETWNGMNGQIVVPKGTFDKILAEPDDGFDI